MVFQSKQAKFLLINERTRVWAIALRTAVLYFLFGVLWILLSDTMVMALIPDEKVRNVIFMSKGVLYVLLSTAFLYSLFYRSSKNWVIKNK